MQNWQDGPVLRSCAAGKELPHSHMQDSLHHVLQQVMQLQPELAAYYAL
jgi:hypothetical protein